MLLEEKMASKDITNAICTKVREEAAIVGWKNKRRKIFDKCKITSNNIKKLYENWLIEKAQSVDILFSRRE